SATGCTGRPRVWLISRTSDRRMGGSIPTVTAARLSGSTRPSTTARFARQSSRSSSRTDAPSTSNCASSVKPDTLLLSLSMGGSYRRASRLRGDRAALPAHRPAAAAVQDAEGEHSREDQGVKWIEEAPRRRMAASGAQQRGGRGAGAPQERSL